MSDNLSLPLVFRRCERAELLDCDLALLFSECSFKTTTDNFIVDPDRISVAVALPVTVWFSRTCYFVL